MAKLKRLGVLSVAKLYAVLMALVGFIFGLFAAIISLFSAIAVPESSAIGLGFGVVSIIVFPVIYAVMGFIVGAIGAFFYNIIAAKFGGIEMDFE